MQNANPADINKTQNETRRWKEEPSSRQTASFASRPLSSPIDSIRPEDSRADQSASMRYTKQDRIASLAKVQLEAFETLELNLSLIFILHDLVHLFL